MGQDLLLIKKQFRGLYRQLFTKQGGHISLVYIAVLRPVYRLVCLYHGMKD